MEEDFDETILDNEEEFKKRFKRIKRPDFVNLIIDKSLRETKRPSRIDKENDKHIEKVLKD